MEIQSNINSLQEETKELSTQYYIDSLIYNLKKLELVPDDSIDMPKISSAINYIAKYKRRELPNKQSLKLFIKEIITIFYKGSSHNLDDFSDSYLNEEKKVAFSIFIQELFDQIELLPKGIKNKDDIIDLTAWISYMFQQNQFFKVNNQLISWIFITYILMIKNLQLPQVLNKEDMILKISELSDETYLQNWKEFFRSQFGAWDIGKKETFNQSLNSKETMLSNITRSIDTVREMQEITGETSLEELIVHDVDRAILQAFIVKFVSEYPIKNEDELLQIVNDYYTQYKENKNIYNSNQAGHDDGTGFFYNINRKQLKARIEQAKQYYISLVEEIEKNKFFLGNEKFQYNDVSTCKKIMAKKEQIINENAKTARINHQFITDPAKKYELYKNLVVDEMLRRLIKEETEQFVSKFIMGDKLKLTTRKNLGRVSWIVAGGPASGKTSIVELAEKDLAEDKINTAKLNPDYYKKILLDPKEVDDPVKHAELTHVESSFINKKIMGKMKLMISKNEAPDILFDAVKASQDKIGVTKEGNATINIYMATCSPEEAIRRAFDRGRRHGRFVPTEIVLQGHQEATSLLPEVLANNKVVFRLFYTEVQINHPPIEIASIYDRSTILDIHNPKLMLDFILKAKINIKAKSPEEVYLKDVYQDKIKQIALCLLEYIKRGLTLRFGYQSKNGKNRPSAIISAKEGFLITNIENFIHSVAGNNSDKDEYVANLIFNLSQIEINNKKLAISIHSGKTCRKDFYIENGERLYATKAQTNFSAFYKKLSDKLDEIKSNYLRDTDFVIRAALGEQFNLSDSVIMNKAVQALQMNLNKYGFFKESKSNEIAEASTDNNKSYHLVPKNE